MKCLTGLLLFFIYFIFAICKADAQGDPAVEEKVFSLMNTSRTLAKLTPLKTDSRLKDTARLHLAQLMKNQQASNQYAGEPSLQERMRIANVQCGSIGEISLVLSDLNQLADKLLNADYRDVLLNPKLSAADVVAEQNGGVWFIVANLIQPLKEMTPAEIEKLIAAAIQDLRTAKKIMPLNYNASSRLRSIACEMAKKDTLKVVIPNPREAGNSPGSATPLVRNFAFTSLDPQILPQSIVDMPHDPKLDSIAVGTCYGSTANYPNGTYWIAIQLYGTGLGKRF
jgi:hypothetical protein